MSGLQRIRQSRYRMLVEGADDLHAVVHLMKRNGVDYDHPREGMPYIDACGSWSQVLEALPVALKNDSRLGVVLDADLPEENRWIKVRERLRGSHVNAPDALPSTGLVLPGWRPQSLVGIWLMPDNGDVGMLEDFLSRLILPDGLWKLVNESTRQAKSKGAKFNNEVKACVRTWLAWQETPGENFGVAISKNYFRADAPEASPFVKWFRNVFPESAT